MNKGCRLRAKGETIEFDTADGKKKFTLKPLKNELPPLNKLPSAHTLFMILEVTTITEQVHLLL